MATQAFLAKRVYSGITIAPTIQDPITMFMASILLIGLLDAVVSDKARNSWSPPACEI